MMPRCENAIRITGPIVRGGGGGGPLVAGGFSPQSTSKAGLWFLLCSQH